MASGFNYPAVSTHSRLAVQPPSDKEYSEQNMHTLYQQTS